MLHLKSTRNQSVHISDGRQVELAESAGYDWRGTPDNQWTNIAPLTELCEKTRELLTQHGAEHGATATTELNQKLPAAGTQRLPEKLLRKTPGIAIELARRAARLVEHGGIKEQRDAPDKRRFFLLHSPALARIRRLGLACRKFRIRVEVAPELAPVFPGPTPRAPEGCHQFAEKSVRGFFFFVLESRTLFFPEKSREHLPRLMDHREHGFAANRFREFAVA
jgi:hypothetical protein